MLRKQLIFCLLFWLALAALTAQTPRPFEAEIRAFERLDSLEKPAKGQILLFGSSTMRLWTTYQTDLAGYKVLNRGFGGSQISDAVYYFDRVVRPLAPAWILLYAGDNDLSNGQKSPEQVFADYRTFTQLVRQKLPGTKVAIYTLRPSLARESRMPQQRQLNGFFKNYARKHRRSAYCIDVYNILLTPAGRPNGDYLDADQLHLNAKGYQVWAQATRDFLKKQGL